MEGSLSTVGRALRFYRGMTAEVIKTTRVPTSGGITVNFYGSKEA